MTLHLTALALFDLIVCILIASFIRTVRSLRSEIAAEVRTRGCALNPWNAHAPSKKKS